MEAAIEFFSQYARQLAIAVLVAVSLWGAKQGLYAIRNWREISDKLAQSKKAKAHDKLTRILIQALSGAPTLIGQAFPIMVIGCVSIIVPLLIANGAIETYEGRIKARENKRVAAGALEVTKPDVRDGDPVSENAEAFLLEYAKSHLPQEQLREAVRKSENAETAFTVLLFLLLVALLVACVGAWFVVQWWLPEQLIAPPMAFWLDKYVIRLISIATKEEARLLVGLEQNAIDEEMLRCYLTTLNQLANKYSFSVSSIITRWLATSEQRKEAGQIATDQTPTQGTSLFPG